jgi:hypothetical protein
MRDNLFITAVLRDDTKLGAYAIVSHVQRKDKLLIAYLGGVL